MSIPISPPPSGSPSPDLRAPPIYYHSTAFAHSAVPSMSYAPHQGYPLQNMQANGQHVGLPSSGAQDKRWYKIKGYPSLSKFMASSPDFFMLRRFDTLNARALLMLQDRLVCQEAELHQLDEEMRKEGGPELRNDTLRLEKGLDPGREALLVKIMTNLKLYNEYVTTYSALRARSSADEKQTKRLQTYFNNFPRTIRADEQAFLQVKGDVVPLVPKAKSPMRKLLERAPSLQENGIFRSKRIPDEDFVYLGQDSLFEWFVNIFTLVVGLALLIGPMWWLQFVRHDVYRLSIITAFVVVFTALLTMSTSGRPFEVLAATAAYSAVLMVFLQLKGGEN